MKMLNVQLRKVSRARRSTSNTRLRRRVWILISCALPFVVQPLFSEEVANEVSTAAEASAEGVPEIAVSRLRPLLKTNLSDAEWRNVAVKLAEALLAAQRPAEALTLLEDPRLGEVLSTKFWRAQALAELHRWNDALSLYQVIGADEASSFRNDAVFGAVRDKQWSIRARLRSAELFLDKSDTDNARRMLDEMNPTASAERKERRFLRARLELTRRHPERAIATFESLVKKPKGANHALVLAALFGVADARLQLKTPELGDDFLEDFIDHHPHDLDLSQIFAKLDELYRAERKPARVELEKWTREHEQPRRA